jgi:hypothetical protein
MARKTWPNPCSIEGIARECADMPNEAFTEMSECRALVVVAPAQSRPRERPQAAFVTQLIACERRIGAYRAARRASSTDAAELYAARFGAGSRSFQRVV